MLSKSETLTSQIYNLIKEAYTCAVSAKTNQIKQYKLKKVDFLFQVHKLRVWNANNFN